MGEGTPPEQCEFEITLLGPGYGESIVMHVGGGIWVLIDSCLDRDGRPRALQYLESIGVDPAEAVALVVATHWHDDHIRGIATLVGVCQKAIFCCAAVLLRKEFLTVVGALEGRSPAARSLGLKEIYGVVSQLEQAKLQPVLALANRRIFAQGTCEIWSLSPGDSDYLSFLRAIGNLLPGEGESKTRIPSLSPNKVAVALWIKVGDVVALLGSDLEKRGWVRVLQSTARPTDKASVFKVPHHGSGNAHEPGVWKQMLDPNPFAVLTPWNKGDRTLPSQRDVQRILSDTTNAYATASSGSFASATARDRKVDRAIQEAGVKIRRPAMSPGAVRLRYPLDLRTEWKVEKFGSACHLKDFPD